MRVKAKVCKYGTVKPMYWWLKKEKRKRKREGVLGFGNKCTFGLTFFSKSVGLRLFCRSMNTVYGPTKISKTHFSFSFWVSQY